MSAFQEIVDGVRGLADWQVRLFSVGCVHRVGPLVKACGSLDTTGLYQEALGALWSGADSTDCQRLARRLELTPEMAAEHSGQLVYWAKLPVVLLTMVLRAGTADDPGDVGRRASSLALELHDSVDAALLNPAHRPRLIDAQRMPPPGQQETAEIVVERRTIKVLRSVPDPASAADQVRGLSEGRAIELASVMPEFLRAEQPEPERATAY